MVFRRYEPEVSRFLRSQLRHATVFYDVGAATGHFSRLALRAMPHGTVVAFEPDPDAAGALRRLNVTVVPVALGAKSGTATLELRPGGSASRLKNTRARLTETVEAPHAVTVSVRSLDSFTDELDPPDVVKIDVEGAEIDVIVGGTTMLGSARALVVECHSMPLLRDVLSLVLEHGFERVSVTRGGDYIGPPAVMAVR